MKLKIIEIPDNIYNSTIFVIPEYKQEDLKKYFLKKYGIAYDETGYDALHYSVINKTQGILHHYLLFEKFRNDIGGIGVFSHEISHLCFSVLRDAGMKFSDDSEEAYSYYIGYLTRIILEKLIK